MELVPRWTPRARGLLGAAIAGLWVCAVAGLTNGSGDQPTLSLSSGNGGFTATTFLPDIPAPAEETTSTIPAAPPTSARRKPAVVARQPVGDYPAGTVMSGPVEMHGVVRNGAGAPVAKACVSVLSGAGQSPVIDVETGDDGAWAGDFDLPSIGDWANVIVRDCSNAVPGFARLFVPILTEPTKSYDVPVTVEPGSALRGTLFSSGGKPVPGTCVLVSMNKIFSFGVVTDAEGRFQLPGLPVGRYGLDARTPGEDGCALASGTSHRINYIMNDQNSDVSYTSAGDITEPDSFITLSLYLT